MGRLDVSLGRRWNVEVLSFIIINFRVEHLLEGIKNRIVTLFLNCFNLLLLRLPIVFTFGSVHESGTEHVRLG